MEVEMILEQSLEEALKIINDNEFISVKDLTAALGVTRSTTDRYLKRLEELEQIRRVQGGAMPMQNDFQFCPSWYYQDNDSLFQERTKLADTAFKFIDHKDCIFLGGGRNILHLARKLINEKICIVTNSLPVALLLSGTANDVNIAGSVALSDEGILVGDSANNMIVQKTFIAPGNINEEGIGNKNQLIVRFEKKFIDQAREVIVLADSEKFCDVVPYRICSHKEIDVVVASRAGAGKLDNIFKKNNVRTYYV